MFYFRGLLRDILPPERPPGDRLLQHAAQLARHQSAHALGLAVHVAPRGCWRCCGFRTGAQVRRRRGSGHGLPAQSRTDHTPVPSEFSPRHGTCCYGYSTEESILLGNLTSVLALVQWKLFLQEISSKTSDRSKLGSVRHVEFRYSPVGIGDSRGSLRRILGHRSRHEGEDEFLCTSTNSLYTGRIGNLDFVPDRPGRLEGDDSPRHFAPSFQTGTHLYERGCSNKILAKPQPIDESFPETTFDNNNNNNNKNSNNKNICRSTTNNNNNKSNKNNYDNKNSSRNSNNHNSSSNHNNKNNNPKNNYNSKHNNNNHNKNNNNQNSNITLHGSSYNPVNCTNNNRWRTWLLASDNKYKEYNKN
ncbi:unnamed protein product [Nesidiocoris tenuis]|uniref:Uncharacterized protein n=1 Tax=Nesidiocoris tenuis TaxID=355587 RepID=A0A6H5GSE6_9HEMI|nr:unnamed protein product [Nesidiocoris tenuis]